MFGFRKPVDPVLAEFNATKARLLADMAEAQKELEQQVRELERARAELKSLKSKDR